MISFCLLFAGHSFSGEPYASSSREHQIKFVRVEFLSVYIFLLIHASNTLQGSVNDLIYFK